jgi:hypothetical protein
MPERGRRTRPSRRNLIDFRVPSLAQVRSIRPIYGNLLDIGRFAATELSIERDIETEMLNGAGGSRPDPRPLSNRSMTRLQRQRLRLANANGELVPIGVEKRAQIGIARLLEPIGDAKRIANDGDEA